MTAGQMSLALGELGTTVVSLALCCHKKPARWLGNLLQLMLAWHALYPGKRYAEGASCANKHQLAAYPSRCALLVAVCHSISSNC